VPVTTLSPESRFLALVPPELPDLAPETRIVLSLQGPAGDPLATRRIMIGELRRAGSAIVFDAGESTLQSGTYRLIVQIRSSPDSPAETIDRAFRIRIQPRQ